MSGSGDPGEPVTQPSDQRPTTEDVGAGRRRLVGALRRPLTRGQLVAAILLGLLGFAAAVQIKATQDADLEGLRQADLVRILDDVTERSGRLQAEARELEDIRDRVSNGAGGAAALEEAQARARTLGILAGTLPATGPGIELTITEGEGRVGSDVLIDALQELRDAGAEVVEISTVGGPAVRVIASTAITDSDDDVVVDGTSLTSPFRLRVIGDPRTLAAALDIPGGVIDVLHQRGATGSVTQHSSVTISSLRAAPSPRYARPAREGDGADRSDRDSTDN